MAHTQRAHALQLGAWWPLARCGEWYNGRLGIATLWAILRVESMSRRVQTAGRHQRKLTGGEGLQLDERIHAMTTGAGATGLGPRHGESEVADLSSVQPASTSVSY